MEISKMKAMLALLTGGVAGIIKYVLDVFNQQVLAKIPNKETGAKYLKDAQAVYTLLRAIMDNHADDFSAQRKEIFVAILAAVEELTKVLEDFTVSETELDAVVAKIQAAIDAWKKAK